MSYIVRNKLVTNASYLLLPINDKFIYHGKIDNKYKFVNDETTVLLRENKLPLVKQLI